MFVPEKMSQYKSQPEDADEPFAIEFGRHEEFKVNLTLFQ